MAEEKDYRRNEDRSQDSRDQAKRDEIMAEDYARMHTGKSSVIATIIRTLIWIAIIYVFIQIIRERFM